MLVCPHCQFENPDAHKFCQSCGNSLMEIPCSTCGMLIPFDLEYCPHCGSFSGTSWQAIVVDPLVTAPNPDPTLTVDPSAINTDPATLPPIETPAKPPSLTPSLLSLTQNKFLDTQQRYQWLDVLDVAQDLTEIEARVLDRHPLQPSFLETFQQQTQELEHSRSAEIGLTAETAIPAHARPYVELQERHPSLSLPQVHDAWEQDGLQITLLGDRTAFPLLLDCCQQEDVLPLQILHWLCEMVEYWQALQPEHYCQSLLRLDNLRIEPEDYVLCLKRLYADEPDHPPTLQDLGNLWLCLFEQSHRTQHADLFLLCRDLVAGAVTSVDELQMRIQTIAASLQSLSPIPVTAILTELQDVDEDPDLTAELTSDARMMAHPSETNIPEIDEEALANESDDLPTVVLPMCLIGIEDAGRTDVGRQRNHNEDCFLLQTDIQKVEGPQGKTVHAKGLYILCDGMGGHASGEVASRMAVETLQQYFQTIWHDKLPSEQTIREAIQLANQAIYDRNQANDSFGSGRMGTTLLLLLLQGTNAIIAHVGDSRLYRFSRREGLEQITTDHEVGQREIQRGVEPAIAYARPDAYQLTQALGPRDENFVNPDIKHIELNEDMLLLLCSDGLTDNDFLELHNPNQLEPMLTSQIDLDKGLCQLIELANQYNGHDNITAVAVRVKVRPNLSQLNPR